MEESNSKKFAFDAISSLLLLATALIGAYLPRYLSTRKGVQVGDGRSLAFKLGNMLSAGVMLSAGFCHLLADSLKIIIFVGKFPLTPFLAAVGYIITLCADQVVEHFTDSPTVERSPTSDTEASDVPTSKTSFASTPKEGHCTEVQRRDAIELALVEDLMPLRRHEASPNGVYRHNSNHIDDHCHMKVFLTQKQLPFATAVLLAAALCVHSILEGMALGSQTTMSASEDIMVAIIAHKGLAAYALGASIMDSKASANKFWTVIGLFAFATPVGIFLGYALTSVSNGAGAAALSALASGTFLYVATMEVIPKELGDPGHRFWKMFMLLLGFGLMSLLAVWA